MPKLPNTVEVESTPPAATLLQQLLHLSRVGARLSAFECLIAYVLPAAYLGCTQELPWLAWNAAGQILLFMPLVIVPALRTGQMWYVDIGWPLGLVLLGANAVLYAPGLWLRRCLMGGCVMLHGARLAVGGMVMFYPYAMAQDLPRYQYARLRWAAARMPAERWPLKLLHDTLQQAAANAALLACPVVLAAFDGAPRVGPVEVLGYALWLGSWGLESLADAQKLAFTRACQRLGPDEAARAVLGHPPFHGRPYWCWTVCRHPNYLGEFCAWQGLVVAALPSLCRHAAPLLPTKLALLGLLLALARFLYDCLLFWTGAEPAEYYSARKRPAFREYQRSTRVFWPVEIPWVDHGRRPMWPGSEDGARMD